MKNLYKMLNPTVQNKKKRQIPC